MTVLFVVLFSSIIALIQSACELNIGLNKFSAFFGKGIYYNGEINEQFKENSTSQFKSPNSNEIDYFYVAEHIGNNPISPMNIEIDSSNASLTNLSMKYIAHQEVKQGVLTGEINIIYNCLLNAVGTALITMKVTPKQCPPFQLKWLKECRPVIPYVPTINLGIGTSNNIIRAGLKVTNDVFIPHSSNPMVLTSSPIHLYISSASSIEKHKLQPIQVNFLHEKDISFSFKGKLVRGGFIPLFPSVMRIQFSCRTERLIDFEVIIPFENNHVMKLYLKTQCAVAARRGFIRTCFSGLYWTLVVLLAALVGIVAYFYFINGMSFDELYNKGRDYWDYAFSTGNAKPMRLPETKRDNESEAIKPNYNEDEMNDEEDLINCQIKVMKKGSSSPTREERTKLDRESSQVNYGGI